jgi:hypothetical protein
MKMKAGAPSEPFVGPTYLTRGHTPYDNTLHCLPFLKQDFLLKNTICFCYEHLWCLIIHAQIWHLLILQVHYLYRIWGFHSGGYEEFCLLGCNESQPTFRRNGLRPSSVLKSRPNEKLARSKQQALLHKIIFQKIELFTACNFLK